jgi:hypothetical protein
MKTTDLEWRIVAASVIGSSHERHNKPCQDAHHFQALLGNSLVIAVADGAGSASLSEVGSKIAVAAAVEAVVLRWSTTPPIEENEWRAFLVDALQSALRSVEAEALAREVSIRELASTLIVLLASPEQVAVGQIGDGAVVLGGKEGEVISLTLPDSGEYLNETSFLISPDAIEMAQFNIWQGSVSKLALFSDGLQQLALKMPEGSPHEPFFAPLFSFVESKYMDEMAQEELVSFLRSPRIQERTDDDLTLVLANLG